MCPGQTWSAVRELFLRSSEARDIRAGKTMGMFVSQNSEVALQASEWVNSRNKKVRKIYTTKDMSETKPFYRGISLVT
jgi:hypothetical protein